MASEEAQQRAAEAISICEDLGFALAGVAPAHPSRWQREVREWLAAGRHGEMGYLERNLELRLNPAAMLQGARSVVMVADQYAVRGAASLAGGPSQAEGRVARYALGRDYHKVIKKRLHELSDRLRARYAGAEFRSFTDTAPVLERELAERAGLGWAGKHTLLIHPRKGSWLLLGGVLTTLELQPPRSQRPIADHCGACTRCIDACPTGCITPHSVDASRCISYLTIEHRSLIDPELHEAIGQWAFGCDICQEVCPHNSPRPAAADVGRAHPDYAPRRDGLDLLDVLGWDESARRRELAATAMTRARLDMLKRNALVVLGNALRRGGDVALRRRIEQIAADDTEPPLVRETARQVLARSA